MSTEQQVDEEASEQRRAGKYVVRCGAMRSLCVCRAKAPLRYGQRVIARTPRGIELGEVLCPATPQAVAHLDRPPEGQVLRLLTPEDENELAHLHARAEEEFRLCQRAIDDLQLDMQLVDVEHLFGGERVVVFYLAENRVDFRQLVKRLAGEFQTRVEMKQIGVRDEARLLADYGDCGKPVCCNTHLSKMPPVSMKMAKLQKATLDPSKISGRCGRLKCCLRYEYDTYVEMKRELPPVGSEVVTADGRARVLGHEILAQQILAETEDHRRVLIALADVLSVTRKPAGVAKSKQVKTKTKTKTKDNPKRRQQGNKE
ncbi:PSP1 domain-containing protein [Roseimaritima sediminicola]|uniref:PSP1 domain-containing protein n=1 Tax=Roseimaritima sediminicola TaxID=2662066 RepID=UPI001F32D681|nr:regulatory iron-sulfur-containing complex subunit RicT [Roseimaritima sediminicola]